MRPAFQVERDRPQGGIETISLVAQSNNYEAITFSTPFANPPAMQVTAENGDYIGSVSLVTETGCRVYVSHCNDTNATINVVAHWTATPIG